MRNRRQRRAVSQGGILEGGWFWGEGTTGDYEQCSLVNTVAGSWLLLKKPGEPIVLVDCSKELLSPGVYFNKVTSSTRWNRS